MDPASLEGVPLFSDLSRRDRRLVARHADEVEIQQGTHLTEQGRLAYELFVIQDGIADVIIDGERVSSLGPGDVAGEIGVLRGSHRTATLVATTPMRLIVMYGPELLALSEELPELFAELERIVAERSTRS